jgi:hypothetical protein
VRGLPGRDGLPESRRVQAGAAGPEAHPVKRGHYLVDELRLLLCALLLGWIVSLIPSRWAGARPTLNAIQAVLAELKK